MKLTRKQLISESLNCFEAGNPAEALEQVRDFMSELFFAKEETAGAVFSFPEGDGICRYAGLLALKKAIAERGTESPQERSHPVDVYIATEIYHHGGHTPLMGDYIRNSDGREARLLLTNIDNHRIKLDDALHERIGLSPEQVSLCGEESMAGKLEWIFSQLLSLKPERVYLCHHQHDSIAVAAVQPDISREFYFVHHVDFNPTLGIDLPIVTHIDLTPYSYYHCRMALGLRNNIFIPLQTRDCGARTYQPSFANSADTLLKQAVPPLPLVTASSGSSVKFAIDGPSPYPYHEVVVGLLSHSERRHVHIGKLSNSYREGIEQELKAHGIDPSHFHYVEHVPALGPAMEEFGIDLYIDSFPYGGAKATVDVMASGTPIAFFWQGEYTRFRETHMSYPEAFTWKTPRSLFDQLASIDADWLQAQSHFARSHFESTHAESRIAPLFQTEGPLTGLNPPPPDGICFADEFRRLYDHYHCISEVDQVGD